MTLQSFYGKENSTQIIHSKYRKDKETHLLTNTSQCSYTFKHFTYIWNVIVMLVIRSNLGEEDANS